MKRYFFTSSIMLLCLFLCTINLSAQEIAFESNSKILQSAEFDLAIKKAMDSLGVSGMSLAIIEDDKIAYKKNYGYANLKTKELVTDNTLFEACSLSKTLVSFFVHKLIEEGKLDIDKPLYLYLENKQLDHDERYKQITAKMILSHTSGLENWTEDNDEEKLEIVSDPGTSFTYSGEGYHYLAKVVEHILNQSYEDYMSTGVLTPFKLNKTTLSYSEKDSLASDFASGHDLFEKTKRRWVYEEPSPASSINTNASEYADFFLHLLTNYVYKQGFDEFFNPEFEIDKNATSKLSSTKGFFLIENENDTIVNFSGSNTGFKADLLYSITNKRGYIFFSNSESGILMSPVINNLTAQLQADIWLKNKDFEAFSNLVELVRLYRKKGIDEMSNAITQNHLETLKSELSSLIYDVYLIDKKDCEVLSKRLKKMDCEWAEPAMFLGMVHLREYKNFRKAKKYFVKAKELGIKYNTDKFINECNKHIKN